MHYLHPTSICINSFHINAVIHISMHSILNMYSFSSFFFFFFSYYSYLFFLLLLFIIFIINYCYYYYILLLLLLLLLYYYHYYYYYYYYYFTNYLFYRTRKEISCIWGSRIKASWHFVVADARNSLNGTYKCSNYCIKINSTLKFGLVGVTW